MAVLLNQASNLRFRLEMTRRLSDGVQSPAALGLRITGGPDAFQVETGFDLMTVLEPVGGQSGEPGSNVALVRFFANGRAVVAFCAALLEEFARFPTDPSRVSPGDPG